MVHKELGDHMLFRCAEFHFSTKFLSKALGQMSAVEETCMGHSVEVLDILEPRTANLELLRYLQLFSNKVEMNYNHRKVVQSF